MIIRDHILTIDRIMGSYGVAERATKEFAITLKRQISTGSTVGLPLDFIGQPISYIDDFTEGEIEELSLSNVFKIIATTEAELRYDFWIRVRSKMKDSLSRLFRKIQKNNENHIQLVEHIIDSWKMERPEHRSLFSQYKAILQVRHWVAHGRYWTPKFGRKYDVLDAYTICSGLISILEQSRELS